MSVDNGLKGATVAATGYTVACYHSSGDRAKTIFLPVVALTPTGSYGAYVAAVLDQRGNLTPVDQLGRTYSVFATPDPV